MAQTPAAPTSRERPPRPDAQLDGAARPAPSPGPRQAPRSTTTSLPARLPPQNEQAEKALLGSMMLDREAVGLVLQIIPREEYSRLYRPDHQKLFTTLIDVYDNGKAMDLVVVRDELER